MSTKPRSVGGRYPAFMSVYRAANITVELERTEDALLVRIDDTLQIDRWEELEIPLAAIKALVTEGGTNAPHDT